MEADTGASFVSTIQPYFRAVTAQAGGEPFQDTEGSLVLEENDATRDSYDTVTDMSNHPEPSPPHR